MIVWNAQKLPEKVVILDAAKGGHKESVKGVSWDPIGKFLCSQSADKTLKVWSTDSWECFTTLAKPFEEVYLVYEWSCLCIFVLDHAVFGVLANGLVSGRTTSASPWRHEQWRTGGERSAAQRLELPEEPSRLSQGRHVRG